MIKFYDNMGASQGISVLSDVVDALDFWQDGTPVGVGDIARSSTNSMIYAVAQTAGNTGTVEPVWGNTAGVTLTDNTVTWLVKDIRTADGAVKADKLATARKINGVAFDGTTDITLPSDTMDDKSYIASGLKIAGVDNKNISISAGAAKIAGKNVTYIGGSIALDSKKAALLYMDSNANLGKVNAAYPIANIDNNTIGLWLFNQTVAGANIPNSAVGLSSNAVDNDLVPHGGITSVDGWLDNALQLDGTTGYFTGSNVTNFPVGTAEREINVLLTINKISAGYFFAYGTTGTGASVLLGMNAAGYLIVDFYSALTNTNFMLEVGKTYLVTYKHDGAFCYIFINGVQILKLACAYATASTGAFSIGTISYSQPNYTFVTMHCVEIRNKMRSSALTGYMANLLMLACFYSKVGAIAPKCPDEYASQYHEYLFNESSGKYAADSNTTAPLQGEATGTTIVDSEIGLSKARKITNLGSGNYISCGLFACGNKFTFIGVLSIQDYAYGCIWSNRNSPVTSGNLLYINPNGYLCFYIGGTVYQISNVVMPLRTPFFLAVTINGTTITTYLNGQKITVTTIPTVINNVANPAYIGYEPAGTYFNSVVNYIMFGNFEMTQNEINSYYNSLMATGRRSILDDVIPAGAISLGFVRTNNAKVIEYNDSDYKYGRREGATGGNRKVFLGWKWFSGGTSLKWDNPFGTGKVSREFHWAQDTKGTNELVCYSRFMDASSNSYGIGPTAELSGYNDAFNITARAQPGWITVLDGAGITNGYIGCYAEVLEEYKGA